MNKVGIFILTLILFSCNSSVNFHDSKNYQEFDLEEKNIKLGIERDNLNFLFFKESQYKMGYIEYGDFHNDKKKVDYIIPIYILEMKNGKDITSLSIRTYNNNEISEYHPNEFLDRQIEYKGYALNIGSRSSHLQNSLQMIKKFEINDEDIWIEFLLYDLSDRYVKTESDLLKFADYFINSNLSSE
jgi:hypothetical protein